MSCLHRPGKHQMHSPDKALWSFFSEKADKELTGSSKNKRFNVKLSRKYLKVISCKRHAQTMCQNIKYCYLRFHIMRDAVHCAPIKGNVFFM